MTAAFQRLCELRWPEGMCCPHCGSEAVYGVATRERFKCADPVCAKQFSPTTGTVFGYRKLSAEKYVEAIDLFPECKSASDMQRRLGVNYRTAHKLWHGLRSTGGKLR